MRAGLTAFLGLVCSASLAVISARPALGQDDFFKPVIEPVPTKIHQSSSQIFSFSRFEPEFLALCTELEVDGRRARIVKIAEAGVEREKECITCRSFWKMVVAACGRLGPRPTPTPKPPKKPRTSKTTEETPAPVVATQTPLTDDTVIAEGGAVETPVSPTPTKGPKQERYPSVALINEASRLSTSVYALDSGEGQVAKTFQYFAKTIRDTADMSSAEREYYDIFLTFLLAAWEGRVDRTKLPPPTPPAELKAFFEQ